MNLLPSLLECHLKQPIEAHEFIQLGPWKSQCLFCLFLNRQAQIKDHKWIVGYQVAHLEQPHLGLSGITVVIQSFGQAVHNVHTVFGKMVLQASFVGLNGQPVLATYERYVSRVYYGGNTLIPTLDNLLKNGTAS